MVLISIRPFAFRKIFLLAATLFCLSSAICLADSLFMSLYSARSSQHASRLQTTPLSPALVVKPVAGISSVGSFVPGLDRIYSEAIVPSPILPGAMDVFLAFDDRSCAPL